MKFFGAVAVLVAGTGAWASDAGLTSKSVVTVCLNPGGNAAIVNQGRVAAAQIFKQAGIRLAWRDDERSCISARNGIVVTLSRATPEGRLPGALAYARLFEGTHIVLFYDRVLKLLTLPEVPTLLGYVLAHEIAHLLQGVDGHSASGIMKAHWDSRDYADMQRGRLSFTEDDILLIHSGLDRSSRPAPAE